MDKPFRRLHVINTELMLLEKILTTYDEPTRGAAWPCKCLSVSFPQRWWKCILRDRKKEEGKKKKKLSRLSLWNTVLLRHRWINVCFAS